MTGGTDGPGFGEARTFYARLGASAIGLAALAVAIVLIEPDAPGSFLAGRGGVILLLLFTSALIAAAVRRLVEWKRGKAPLAGPWWVVMRTKVLFQLALLGALPALGFVTALVWIGGGAWADLLWHALLLLLVGGALVGIAGGLVAHLLFLLLPRQH